MRQSITIAQAKPFSGAPGIHAPALIGAEPGKPFLFRIPVTGERPLTCRAEGLPDGLTLEGQIISGTVPHEGSYPLRLIAENAAGRNERTVTLDVRPGGVLLTPLMGLTTWNAFGSRVSQEKVLGAARRLINLGLAEYGYGYVNIDSGWQGQYGGAHDAIQPNGKFPDMRALCDELHAMGLHAGIYSTPMLTAWGCPEELPSIPGCTRGEPDELFADVNGGIGRERCEQNNADQWAEWGFDYLKYDWHPCDPYNAERMRQALLSTGRTFGFCVTVTAVREYHRYWRSRCSSFRCGTDTDGTWATHMKIYRGIFDFLEDPNRGHFFDMDMLDVGTPHQSDDFCCRLTEDEQVAVFTMRAFFQSPLQIGSTLEAVTPFELSLYANEEVLAVHQDTLCAPARPCLIREEGQTVVHAFGKRLADGSIAYAVFDLGETAQPVTLWLDGKHRIRDLWQKQDIASASRIDLTVPPHSARLFRCAPTE